MSKGSVRRPPAVDRKTRDENWARTFGEKKQEPKPKEEKPREGS